MTTEPTMRIVMGPRPERACGSCSLCCKLMPMRADSSGHAFGTAAEMIKAGMAEPRDFDGMLPEWHKPAGEPCTYQRHGKGCAIYARRPFACRTWSCRWLTGEDTADQRRPDRSRIVIDMVPDYVTVRPEGAEPMTIPVVQYWCDPATPEAWRDPAMMAFIERRAREGYAAQIRYSNDKAIVVFAPPFFDDGRWHVERGGTMEHSHDGADRLAGLAQARKVKFTTGA